MNNNRRKSFLQNCKQSVIPEEEEETSDHDQSAVMDPKLNSRFSKDTHQTNQGQSASVAASVVREDINQTMTAGKIES